MSLTTPEKHQRLSRLHSVARNSTKQIERLRQKIATLIKTDEIEVEDELDNDVREMAKEHEKDAMDSFPEGSFPRLFW